MGPSKVLSARDAVQRIASNSTVATGGFVGIGFPEELAIALERRFLSSGEPSCWDGLLFLVIHDVNIITISL